MNSSAILGPDTEPKGDVLQSPFVEKPISFGVYRTSCGTKRLPDNRQSTGRNIACPTKSAVAQSLNYYLAFLKGDQCLKAPAALGNFPFNLCNKRVGNAERNSMVGIGNLRKFVETILERVGKREIFVLTCDGITFKK